MRKAYLFLFLFLFSISAFSQDELRVQVVWQVKSYDIEVSFSDRFLLGKALLVLQNTGNSAGSRVTLRINEKAEVTSVKVNDSAGSFTKGQERLGAKNLQRIIVSIPSTQPNSTVSLTIEYKLKIEENSGLSAISPVGLQFLPLSFWYPTPNTLYAPRGGDFAPFRLVVNSQMTVVSSGNQSGNTFQQRANGLPFFVAGDWDVVSFKGVTVYLPKGAGDFERQRASELANLFVEAKTFVASLLGSIDETPARIVAVRRGAGFADSSTILLEYGAFRRHKIDSQTAMTIAEAAVKLWLGNAVLVREEGYGVIREGLTRYIANLFIEKQFGKEAAENEWFRQRISYAAIARREVPLSKVSPLDDFYFALTANKGAMIWRLLARRIGQAEFFRILRSQLKTGALTLSDVRLAFADQKEFLEFWLDQTNDVNLLVGLPQASGDEKRVALRNNGSIPVETKVTAFTDKGEKLIVETSLQAKSFGEAVFRTASKVVRVEVDPEKLYPQLDFSDDVAPREFSDSDAILIIKRSFDRQDFVGAEKAARTLLESYPGLDDARILLGRSLLAQNKLSEAEKQFQTILDEKLVLARNSAWAYVGLGEIATRANKTSEAVRFFEEAIRSDAEYGATLAARMGRNKVLPTSKVEESIRNFFIQFDRAAISKSRANVEQMIVSGEMVRFASNLAGQAELWETKVVHVDPLDANNVLVEVELRVRLLNRSEEKGMAVFYLSRTTTGWKLSGVEIFEVRAQEQES